MAKLKVCVIVLTVVTCSIIAGKSPEKRGRKDIEPIIDPELEKLIPSSDADVAGSPLSAPLKIEIVDEIGIGAVEESPSLSLLGEKSERGSKEPSYKAIVIEDTPGGWGFGWDNEGDTEEALTYHGYGLSEQKQHGWKHGDEDVQHGWKHNMEHHHGWHQKHGHDHKHGHKHGHDHKHGHKHGHKHDHKHGHKHGHDHKHGHKHGHHHKHGHKHEHGHKHDHGHKHHHKHEHHHHHHHHHGHKHGHDHKGWHEGGGGEGGEGGGDEGGDER